MVRPHGYILMPVVVLLGLVAAVAFMLNHESALDSGITASSLDGQQAEYIAQAGLNHALWQIRQQGCGPHTNLSNQALGNHSYSTTLTTTLGGTTSYTIDVDQDTWIRSDQPTNNYASDSKLHMRFESGTIERPLYRYDLSPIAANTNIVSAIAWFYVSKAHPQGPLHVHLLNADWSESNATWDTMGSHMDTAVQATIASQPAAGVWVAVNLTSQVQAWVNGQPNYGIALNAISEGIHGDYASTEAVHKPYLEVITGTPVASASSLQSVVTLANGTHRSLQRDTVMLYQAAPGVVEHRPDAGAGIDTYVSAASKNSNFGTDDETWVASTGGNEKHALFQFDVAAVPIGADIVDATLSLYHRDGNDADVPISAHRMLNPWTEDKATWHKRDQTNNWGTNGGDYDLTVIATTQVGPASSMHYDWDITPLVRGWVNGDYPNYGVLLRTAQPGMTGERFDTSDHSDPVRRPVLRITYRCICGQVCVLPQGNASILFVVSNAGAMTSSEQAKKALFESWGYSVDPISQWDVEDDFNSRALNNDVVYVSEAVFSGTEGMASKLAASTLGVVNEEGALNDDLGIASGSALPVGHTVTVTDNSHYITQPFATGDLQIYTDAVEALSVSGSTAGGLQTLAEWGGLGALVVLDAGAELQGGGNAAGRRVMLPAGRDFRFQPDMLNSSGRLLMQKSIQWASGQVPSAARPFVLSTDTNATLGGLSFQDTDLAKYVPSSDIASLYLDSAAVGLSTEIDALHVLANGHLLLSTKLDTNFAGLAFDKEDLVEYDPVANSATMYLKATDHFETTRNIISVHLLPTGNLVLSTDGNATLGGVSFSNKDLVEYNRVTGNAVVFFDGDATSLSQKITAVHILDNGHIVLAADGNSTLGGLSFGADQLIEYDPVTDTATQYFNGEIWFAQTSEKIRSVYIDAGSSALTAPLAHWKLDETAGTDAADSAGGHDGILSDGPLWTGGQLDGALNLDGINDYIDVTHDDSLSLTDGMSFTAWVNAASYGTDYQAILAKQASGSASNYWFGAWQDELVFGFNDGAFREVMTTAVDLQPGIWYHLAATFDNTNDEVVLYVDGIAVQTAPFSFAPVVGTAGLTIGRSASGEYWHGRLDDVRIYDEVLSAIEIATLAQPPDENPVAHWPLDETAGATTQDVAGGQHGALSNSPAWTSAYLAGGLLFDGDNDRVDVGSSPSLDDLFASGATITAWIRASGWGEGGSGRIADKADNVAGNRNGWAFGLDGGNRSLTFQHGFSAGTGSWATPLDSISLDTWHHVAVVYDSLSTANAPTIFIDGVMQTLIETDTPAGSASSDSGINLALGNYALSDSRTFDGVLDDVRVFDSMLDAADISGLAAASSDDCTGSYRDNFDAPSWSGSNGTQLWSASPWAEVGESDGPGSGDVVITTDLGDSRLGISDNQNGGEGVERVADLSGATTATLSLHYRRDGLDDANDYVAVYLSSNGTAGPWTEIVRFQGSGDDTGYQSFSQDISAYISTQTAIRLRSSSSLGNNDFVWFDNVQIECQL